MDLVEKESIIIVSFRDGEGSGIGLACGNGNDNVYYTHNDHSDLVKIWQIYLFISFCRTTSCTWNWKEKDKNLSMIITHITMKKLYRSEHIYTYIPVYVEWSCWAFPNL
jgi:hypothetical protein